MKIERVTQRVVRPAAAAAEEGYPSWVALSSADLVMPALHMELVVAYEGPAAPQTGELEEALGKVLCSYREWAGRIDPTHLAAGGRPAIVLNDAGVAFAEARGHAPLHHLVPCFDSPSALLRDLILPSFGASELLLVQVTRFACGGIVVGVAWHHQVADAEALMEFMHAWALTTKGSSPTYTSSQDRTLLVARTPPQPLYDHDEFMRSLILSKRLAPGQPTPSDSQEIVVRKLHFSETFLQEIKVEAKRGGGGVEAYTRFESLLGHLWRCITKARGLAEEEAAAAAEEDEASDNNNEEGEPAGGTRRLEIAVNARKRMNPRIEDGYFGNVVCHTCAKANVNKLVRSPLGYAAKRVKEAIKKVDEEYVRSSLDYGQLKERCPNEAVMQLSGVTPHLCVSSWATLPLYSLDFGSGCPLYAGNVFTPFEGFILILPPPPAHAHGSLHVVLSLFKPAMEKLLSIYDSIF